MKVRVLCVGNSLARDDGVGMYVAKILESCTLPGHVVVERRPSLGFDLLDLLDGGEHLVIVDAMHSGAVPGSCRVLDVELAADLARRPYCGHAVGLAEVLAVAARLPNAELPSRITVLGVEALALDSFGTDLSDPVRQALPELLERVVEVIGGDAVLLEQARAHARAIPSFELEEALGLPSVSAG